MTSKETELKALDRIMKIVADLGENSYIAAAFEGCFEIAAENIANDWACSMKQRAEAAEKKADEMEKDLDAAKNKLQALEKNKGEMKKSNAALWDTLSPIYGCLDTLIKHMAADIDGDKQRLLSLGTIMADLAGTNDIALASSAKAYKETAAHLNSCEHSVTILKEIAKKSV